MVRQLGAAFLLLGALLLGGCFFGGDDKPAPSVRRPSSIPTATPPANLPDPIILSETQSATPGAGGTGGAATYVVKSGDTLFGIAGQLGVPAEQQAAWATDVLRLNSIADAATLRVGQELRLPATTARATGTPAVAGTPARTSTPASTPPATGTRAATAVATPATPAATGTRAATPAATVTSSGRTYTVVAGDYPFLIAAKLSVPEAQQAVWVNQLIALNSINPAALLVGQVLQLPAGTP